MTHTTLSHRRGFTLVEMLVVIAILGVLVGLLLPAVQRVRDSARRSSCANNLRQLGIAMMGHESTFGAFPAGRRGGVGGPAESGFVTILPRIEEQPLFDTLKLTGTAGLWRSGASLMTATGSACWGPDAATQARVREAVRQRPSVFVCPADSLSQPLNSGSAPFIASQNASSTSITVAEAVPPSWAATASYAMCSGRTPMNDFTLSDRLADARDDGQTAATCGLFEGTGRPRAKEDVRDGLGRTFMLGETIDTHAPGGFNLWSVALAYTFFSSNATIGTVNGGALDCDNSSLRCTLCAANSRVNRQDCARRYPASGAMTNPQYVISTAAAVGKYKGFDSLHAGGLVFVFGDGHTEFIDEQIDFNVYRALSTVNGREQNHTP